MEEHVLADDKTIIYADSYIKDRSAELIDEIKLTYSAENTAYLKGLVLKLYYRRDFRVFARFVKDFSNSQFLSSDKYIELTLFVLDLVPQVIKDSLISKIVNEHPLGYTVSLLEQFYDMAKNYQQPEPQNTLLKIYLAGHFNKIKFYTKIGHKEDVEVFDSAITFSDFEYKVICENRTITALYTKTHKIKLTNLIQDLWPDKNVIYLRKKANSLTY